MLISNSPNFNAVRTGSAVNSRAAHQVESEPVPTPSEIFSPSPSSVKPKERIPAWTALANAGVVGALVAVPAFMGAAGNAVFGAHPLVPVGVSALTVASTGTYAFKSSMKEFNGHPVLVGLSTLVSGVAALVAAPILSIPGAAFGWKGAAVATAVAAVGTGVISAIGIQRANEGIDAHNALFEQV